MILVCGQRVTLKKQNKKTKKQKQNTFHIENMAKTYIQSLRLCPKKLYICMD